MAASYGLLLLLLTLGCLQWAVLAQQWSGYVNEEGGSLNYGCPQDTAALSGVASDYFVLSSDRRWDFLCTSAGGLANVSLTCSILPAINDLLGELNFDCPGDGFLTGLSSVFTDSSTDRVWQPNCCTRPFASLINCQKPSSTWNNVLRDNLNFTGSGDRVVAGLESFYFNKDRRWRFRTCELEVDCGDPGVPDNAVQSGDSFLYNSTVTFTCNHGYYQSSGAVGGIRRCLETGLWSDSQPVCTGCTAITDCEDIRCTGPTNQSCALCASKTGPGLGERAFTNTGTHCQPKCSWLTTFCYPGVCTELPSSCNCTTGFHGDDCLQISDSAALEDCTVGIVGADGSQASLSCQPNTTTPLLYTNIVPYQVTGEWGVAYTPPTPLPQRPAYVGGFSVGVAVTEIQAILYRAANPSVAVSMTTHPCERTSVSPDSPIAGVVLCSSTPPPANLTTHTFLHGDTFELRTVGNAGGHLDILDLDHPPQSQRHYYTATPTSGEVTFILDLQPPTHCSLVTSSNCPSNQNLLSLSGDIVTSNQITASWGGWLDIPSGVVNYELTVHYLEYTPGLLTEGAVLKVNRTSHDDQLTYSDVTTLPREGPYSFILKSHDLAGNTRISRRTLLYDFNSSVEINPFVPLIVTSAVPSTDYIWQNSTDKVFTVSGSGHFYNTNLRSTNYLAPLANYSVGGVIDEAYDQVLAQGRYPRQGTINALGIVELNYDIIIDRVGGNSSDSLTQPIAFPFQTSDIGMENVEIRTELQDGDSVKIWFQAIDFRFQYSVDSVLVHVDSSPPELSELGLYWSGVGGSGVGGLSLHGTGTLLDLDIRFQVQDQHSGIYSVEWSISTVIGSETFGSGGVAVPMSEPHSCAPPQCVCDPLHHCTPVHFSIQPPASDFSNSLALHDTDYIVTVTVSNHARLTSTLSHRFTVDTTPPLQGYVIDGQGSKDIDYQTTFELSASWTGFFDRESDVAFYQYIFGTECANSSLFMYPLTSDSDVIQTIVTMAARTAPIQGTYFVTVVAFNQALQPSNPVCSDGVTVDTVAPVIAGVVIPGAVVQPGLVSDVEGMWYVREDRVRVWVGACPNLTTPIVDLSPYPIGTAPSPDDVCSSSTLYTPSQLTHLTQDHTLNVTWSATDNIGISHFEVGIISETNFTENGQNIEYFHTAGQSHYSFHNSELLSNGNLFYVSLRVFDLAQQMVVLNIGPILVDVTPPTFNATLEVVRNGDHVILEWKSEDLESGIEQFQFAIGKTEFGIQVSDFAPLPLSTPPQCPTPLCVAIETTTLPLLSGREYYITIQATNGARLSSYISKPFTQISGAPSLGYVFDIDPTVPFNLTSSYSSYNKDIDILVDSERLSIKWGGFVHPHLPVNYSVFLGSSPGIDDIVTLVTVGTETAYEFTNVSFTSGNVYYSTVIAENIYGRVSVSSDSVLVLSGVRDSLSKATVLDQLVYQVSTSAVSANWVFPDLINTHASRYEWALLGDGYQATRYTNVGKDTNIIRSVNGLQSGIKYRSSVRACFPDFCLDPILSDGFYISIPPSPRSIQAVYTPIEMDEEFGTSNFGSLYISWDAFVGEQISYYEWSIGNSEMGGQELIVNWNRVYGVSDEVHLNASLSLHKTNYITVRGYNYPGLSDQSTALLKWRINEQEIEQNQVPRNPLIVFDITESDVPPLLTDNWKEIEHIATTYTDIDYADITSLSAAWPDLRYSYFHYSISRKQEFSDCQNDPHAITCGNTIGNAVTATNLDLVNGERYYFCVQGLLSDATHPTPHTPHTLTHCSNGVVVDLIPPTSGCVEILTLSVPEYDYMSGSGSAFVAPDNDRECSRDTGIAFQVSSSEMFVVWEEFSDVEGAWHVGGVANYQYAIGTSAGSSDVLDFTSVGVTTYAVARDLSLETGLTYYVAIRGIDFVGHVTDAYSQPVTVDMTPPDITSVWIEGANNYIENGLRLNWDLPRDGDSGVEVVEWAIGSRSGSSDGMEWRPVDHVSVTRQLVEGTQFSDGQTIFLSIRVTNGAGLTTISSSAAYTLDHTPPAPGHVYDGPYITADVSDLDYSTDLSNLNSHWTRFTDPHTDVVEYFIAMGTTPGGTDVQDTISVGVASSVTLTSLTLSQGHTYYTTVTACNALKLCSSASSNGITVDVTPPTPGRVLNSYSGPDDIQFQGSRSTISARWIGFHDDESSLQYFTYYIGLSPNDSSVIPPTRAPPTQTSFIIHTPLQTHTLIYTTVVAVNGAGVKTQASSSGLYIDDTTPEITEGVAIHTEWTGSISMATQYSTSALRIQWNFIDSHTSINQHFWFILSDSNTITPIPGTAIGSQSHATATNLEIRDGDTHSAILIGCNQAGLCTQSTSRSVLFDSSPPIDGYFAAYSASMASLNRTVPGGMTWRNRNVRGIAQIDISFLGFSDPHSGIAEYWLSVGTLYSGSDLLTSMGPQLIQVSPERGVILAEILLNRLLVVDEVLHVSIWAINGVGLESYIVRGSFTVDPPTTLNNNGTLTLLRSSSCPLTSCLGHCACGARESLCKFGTLPPCQKLTPSTLPPELQVSVLATSPQLIPGASDSILFTTVTDKLVAEIAEPVSMEIQRLEWSVSEEGFSPGLGVQSSDGITWRGVGNLSRLVFSSAQSLKHGVSYIFHVRAWYNDTSYAVFTSNSITVDTVGTATMLGERVKVSDNRRFTSDLTSVSISLQNLFVPSMASSISTFRVAIGDSLHADNIHSYTDVDPLTDSLLSNLDLKNGRTYYITAQGISPLGITTPSISRPLTVDLTPPTQGHLFTGTRTREVTSQTNSTAYTARWLGFNNALSGINHYELALTTSHDPPTQYTNIGIALSGTLNSLTLNHGVTYYSHLVAVSNAGVRSEDFVLRRGLVIDNTAPIGLSNNITGDNIISNPSFEGVMYASECPQAIDNNQATQNWTISGESLIVTTYNDYNVVPVDGCLSLLLSGSISQAMDTSAGVWYRASLSIHQFSHTTSTRLTMKLAGASVVCEVGGWWWGRCQLLFQASHSTTIIQLTTAAYERVIIDEINIVRLSDFTDTRNGLASLPNDPTNAISISMEVISSTQVRLQADWLIADPESGVQEFMWAVGTVRGGQQKQRYRSTGTNPSAISGPLSVGHNEMVYVTVVATNFAGLREVFYSRPFIVDHTPPRVSGRVWDGVGGDIDYQSEEMVSVDWAVAISDPESGLKSCIWAIGTIPGATDVRPYIVMSGDVTSSHSNDLSPLLRHGTKVYSTVTCTNRAGHHSNAYSDGVTILSNPPNSSLAFATLSSPEMTQYDIILGYLPSNRLTLVWGGFAESADTPLEYELRITISSDFVGDWENVGFLRQLTLNDIELLSNNSHVIQVRAVNLGGLRSDPVNLSFTILDTPPINSGIRVNDTWLSSNQLSLDWSDKFTDSALLRYELSIGTQRGSGSVQMWVEFSSEETSLTLSHPQLLRRNDYFLSLIAISPSGLYVTVNQVIAGIPMVT